MMPRPIVAISSVAGVPPEKIEELEAYGYVVVEVLSVDDIKVLNGRAVEKTILRQLSWWARFKSLFA